MSRQHIQLTFHQYKQMTLQVKCDQYWPSRGTETYGMIQVTMLDTAELATYSVRTFSLYKVSSVKTIIFNAVCNYLGNN